MRSLEIFNKLQFAWSGQADNNAGFAYISAMDTLDHGMYLLEEFDSLGFRFAGIQLGVQKCVCHSRMRC